MDYPDVTSWRPGEPEPSGAAHRPDPPATPEHLPQPTAAPGSAATSGGTWTPAALAGEYDPPPRPVAVDAGARPTGGDPLGWPTEEFTDIPPAKPRSLTPTRLLTMAILIALAFLGGVYVQKQHTYGYTPPTEAPKEFVPHGH